jgi:anti-sigma B factor antagonist
MEYRYEVKDDLLILHFKGDLIGENHGPELISIVNDQIKNDIVFTIIDLSEIRYINSSGIGVLITMLTKFRNRGGDVVLINPSKTVEKLLTITKLKSIFTISDSVEEAVKELKK